jgi:hypothetical protein
MRSPVQAAPVQRAVVRAREMHAIAQQGCNIWKCGSLAITCAAACLSGVGTAACITCLGSAYEECKGCF